MPHLLPSPDTGTVSGDGNNANDIFQTRAMTSWAVAGADWFSQAVRQQRCRKNPACKQAGRSTLMRRSLGRSRLARILCSNDRCLFEDDNCLANEIV
jgi:hypothetical protein